MVNKEVEKIIIKVSSQDQSSPKRKRMRELGQLMMLVVLKGLLKLEWAVETGRVHLSPSDISALLELSNILESAIERHDEVRAHNG